MSLNFSQEQDEAIERIIEDATRRIGEVVQPTVDEPIAVNFEVWKCDVSKAAPGERVWSGEVWYADTMVSSR